MTEKGKEDKKDEERRGGATRLQLGNVHVHTQTHTIEHMNLC